MDNEQRQKIAIKIYESTGVMYDKDDPVFALAIINTEVNRLLISDLEQKQQHLINAIEEIPSMIEASLNTLITGLEEAEKSFDGLTTKHSSILNNQLDETKLEIRSAIKSAISDGMYDAVKSIKDEVTVNVKKPLQESVFTIDKINNKLKSASDNFHDKRSSWFIASLLAISVFSIVIFSAISYIGYSEIQRLQMYYNGYTNQKATLERLPKNVQKQFSDELHKYLNE